MEKVRLREILSETIGICRKFFRKIKISEKELEVPKNLKWMSTKIALVGTTMNVIGIVFSFFLTFANFAIEAKMIFLGIMLFMLYKGEGVIEEAVQLYNGAEKEKNSLIKTDEIAWRGSRIIANVSGKVMKYYPERKIYRVMTNEEILNSIKRYLDRAWGIKIYRKFDMFDMICAIAMLAGAIATNRELPQVVFVPMLVIFAIITFISSAYSCIINDKFYKANREFDDKQSIILNDVLRIPEIAFGRDMKMRIALFQKTVKEGNKNAIQYTKNRNINNLIMATLNTLSQYGIIILYLFGVNWSEITVATIAEITATLAVTQTALRHISRIFRTMGHVAEDVGNLEREEEDVARVMSVYRRELERQENVERITDMIIPPFEVGYIETSENDKPFTLALRNPIEIPQGSIVIELGTSGSGKSTFSKMVAQKISLTKSDEIPSTTRFMYYDETLRFGNLTIYEEIFCCDDNPDHSKMRDILENLGLWEEISRTCHDVWQWMKEKKFDNSLSNGQKQRLILAKMLYWLDDDVDVVVLDEATSGLDDKNSDGAEASEVLEYIVDFVNKDKRRTTFISTHQDISGFVETMNKKKYNIITLKFNRAGKYNVIERGEN